MKKWIGGVIWIIALIFLFNWIQWPREPATANPTSQIGNFLLKSRQTVRLEFENEELLRVGDLIFEDDPDKTAPVGKIVRVESPTSQEQAIVYTNYAVAEFFGTVPPLYEGSATVTYHDTPNSLEWVVATMLPPQKQAEIRALIMSGLNEHRDAIWQELQPILGRAINDSQLIIQRDLREAIRRRADEFSAIASNYQEQFIEREIMPVLEQEVWPIIREETAPLIDEVGGEIWNQVSLWRFTWRYLYDASPLPARELTRKEFNRFVDSKAVPILKAHWPEFVDTQKRVLERIASNEPVQEVFQKGIEILSRDEQIRAILNEIFLEVFVNNEDLREIWRRTWESAEMQQVMADANERLGPTVTAIGEAMFGNPRKSITPEFSEVLRSRVLFKDQRWLVLHMNDEPPTSNARPRLRELVVQRGDPDSPRPFHVPARPR
jgi:hypothetical protein